MEKNLLSIDWDYFIPIKKEWCGSYIENKRNISKIWYNRYISNNMIENNLEESIHVGSECNDFWDKIKKYFNISKSVKVFISDSHKLSYKIAKENACNKVFSFDAHSDLGYGGLKSLDFELNCANWLGKLLKDCVIKKANIIYSPYSYEKKEDFNEMNTKFNIDYCNLKKLKEKEDVTVIHICRSGAWTPPWLDCKFRKFVKNLKLPYKVINCPNREWNIENLTLSEQLDYILC
ncbi:arginase [Crassaminicella profunda]|uniref:arginase n=1 Tax=Crassaminicella profunda TaxID=1286698 RepID=UPI001CA76729|nr:arginase [Crassaminicella profunda]QZY56383.1 arginase [Crassaminicella profunda]